MSVIEAGCRKVLQVAPEAIATLAKAVRLLLVPRCMIIIIKRNKKKHRFSS